MDFQSIALPTELPVRKFPNLTRWVEPTEVKFVKFSGSRPLFGGIRKSQLNLASRRPRSTNPAFRRGSQFDCELTFTSFGKFSRIGTELPVRKFLHLARSQEATEAKCLKFSGSPPFFGGIRKFLTKKK